VQGQSPPLASMLAAAFAAGAGGGEGGDGLGGRGGEGGAAGSAPGPLPPPPAPGGPPGPGGGPGGGGRAPPRPPLRGPPARALVVDQGQELVGGVGVALLDGRQDARHVTHGRPMPSSPEGGSALRMDARAV